MTKKTFLVLLASILVITMVGCGVNKKDLVGTWRGSWNMLLGECSQTVTFNDNNSCHVVVKVGGVVAMDTESTYSIDGNFVMVEALQQMKFENGKLIYVDNPEHVLTKSR